ncbi:vacuolar import and degradation protein-domain-containing protein [Neurospora tetraspora]|uniref:Vacuolar import and degradation protein-domain-containing protein n=1 Tax=Neurospora tetraspora TaxID=94610 RepID=A0AAE0MN81_9PEZI|nr:vacuolar import and degradation protein-domain-containing protein [Neurospora tetraspora]
MPRASPSNDAIDPLSPRPYPFSSCPDPDDSQMHSQPHHQYSSPSMIPAITAPSTADDTERPGPAVMSPESQSEVNRNVDIDHGPERMRDARRDADEAHKQRTETDDETPGTASDSAHAVHVEQANRTITANRVPAITANRVPTITSNIRPLRTHGVIGGHRSRKQGDELVAPSATTLGQVEEVDLTGNDAPWVHDYGLAGLSYEYCQTRLIPSTPSSYLRPGSKFSGMQKSERSRYDVEVEIKQVDLRESFLCGYLRIQGLTDTHPTLTTYFEGEIIGPHYSFLTQHPQWGANDKIDISHWNKFVAFKPYAKTAKRGGVQIKDVAQKDNIFMRWKEQFLVPNHRVKTINGASFEGFYYICFNQVLGTIQGIYFHSKSEKFQQLELKHVQDKGCFGAMEFR